VDGSGVHARGRAGHQPVAECRGETGWSVCSFPISAGRAAGELRRLITTMTAGSILSLRANQATEGNCGCFEIWAAKAGGDVTKDVRLDAVKLNQPRAIAVADIDGNGDADLVVTQLGGAPLVLRNEGGNKKQLDEH